MSLIADAISAASGQADLLVLPELATTQYDIRRHIGQIAPALDGEQFTELRELARQAHLVAVVGLVEVADPVLYNSAAVIDADGSLAGVVRKSHLFAGERRVFAAGSTIGPIRTSLGQLGVAVCYDIEFPEVARSLAVAGAEALIVISANMHPYTDYHLTYAKSRAMENGIPVSYTHLTLPTKA